MRDQAWPIARYRFVFITQTPVCLPDYAGSMLRGAFGQALRRIACMTREPACSPCPLYSTCPYTLIFETPPPPEHSLQRFSAVQNPYTIKPPPWGRRVYPPGDKLVFEMTLFGQALEKLALIVFAWQRAFAGRVGGGTAALGDVLLVDSSNRQSAESVFDAATNRVLGHDQRLFTQLLPGHDFSLSFVTPLRIQENGRALPPENITSRALLMALARRVSLLMEFHAGFTPTNDFQNMSKSAETVSAVCDLRWRHWERWSSRQKTTMTLNGLVGTVILDNVPTEFHAFLHVGQWTHLGKNATFGLGRYILEAVRP